MKAILKFDLEDADDRMDHKACIKATDMALVIWDFFYNTVKTKENEIAEKKLDGYQTLDYLMERFRNLLDENGIIIDELVR
jgi:hypothetical protein